MTYDEAYKEATAKRVSVPRAKRFIEAHGEVFLNFAMEVPTDKDYYTGKQILDWLGY